MSEHAHAKAFPKDSRDQAVKLAQLAGRATRESARGFGIPPASLRRRV